MAVRSSYGSASRDASPGVSPTSALVTNVLSDDPRESSESFEDESCIGGKVSEPASCLRRKLVGHPKLTSSVYCSPVLSISLCSSAGKI